MSNKSEATPQDSSVNSPVILSGIFAFKQGMSTIYDDAGNAVPVTILKQDRWVVTQIKSEAKDGYVAVQIACHPKAVKNSIKSERNHFKPSGFETCFEHVKEIRQVKAENVNLGGTVSPDSLKKGDIVKITGRSKGRGFQGSVKRYGFGGGPGAHGSKFHRQPGSIGNRTWPARVMPGKRFPGHMGDRQVTIKNVEIMDVIPEESVVIVRGAVPGAPNGLVRLMKE